MVRASLLLVSGAALGAGLVHWLDRDETPPVAPAAAPAEIPAADVAAPRVVTDGAIASRIAVYEQAIQAADPLDLESLLEIAAVAPASRARDREVAILLARLAELDPARAVAFSLAAFLEPEFLDQAFGSLARADADAALDALSRVSPAAKQRQVAIGLLGVFGYDDAAVERIARALPAEDRPGFEIDALIARAGIDPVGALAEAFSYNLATAQTYLLPRIAELAARRDPLGALALSDSMTDFAARFSFQAALLRVWAEEAPDAVFGWLESSGAELTQAGSGMFQTLAQHNPERLLAMVPGLPSAARGPAQRAVMQVYAERDPSAAIAMLDTLPVGQERESLLSTIATTYGQQNPDLALGWVRSLSPPSPGAFQAVLAGIAAVDVDRAIDAFIAELDQPGTVLPANGSLASAVSMISGSMLMRSLSSNSSNVLRLADRLIEIDDPRVQSMLGTALSVWIGQDADAAMSWTIANAGRLDQAAMRSIARTLADQDSELAISTLELLPAEQRAGWIEGIVPQMARADVAGARNMIERFRGQPGYDRALSLVVQEMARSDPAGAARVLAESPDSPELAGASFSVAREWASRDPLAAARWAQTELGDGDMRSQALTMVAMTWVQRDSAAAERWLFSLPGGADRDAAADGYLMTAAQVGQFEPRILEAYSNDAAGQRGLSQAITTIAYSNPDRARELINTYLTDPAIRAQTEEQIARLSARSSGALTQGAILLGR